MRHLLGISGGKDSAALAIYLSRKTDIQYYVDLFNKAGLEDAALEVKRQGTLPEIEYFFTDTGKELPEVYSFLDKMEVFLGRPIIRLAADLMLDDNKPPFDHYLIAEHGGMLPSRRVRWCTYKLKLRPLEKFVGGDEVISYVGIRADEDHRARISAKKNIHAVYPFVEADMQREDILELLNETVGIPEYYHWRSRSGCFFCFFQRKSEWLGLRENHPDLFEQAMQYEEDSFDPSTGRKYTWIDGMSLQELDRMARDGSIASKEADRTSQKILWMDSLTENLEDDDPEDHACAICSL